jgi:glycosyltransferase involved in cell wall biosynthesis
VQPLVSIMVPCYNAATTLPLALSSLLAQTYENWECVIVDDGSTDSTWDILHALSDPRFHRGRFPENRGRGAARQACLERARGQLFANLDADDWLFPGKLAQQVDALVTHDGVVAVSGGLAITNACNEIVGVRGCAARTSRQLTETSLRRPQPPPIPFPPMMVRVDAAKQAGFDPRFLRTQDSDFLLRVLLGRRYILLPHLLYAYSEAASMTLKKILQGSAFRMRMLGRYWRKFPLASASGIAVTATKHVVYRVAGIAGFTDALIRRRSRPPRPDELREFFVARDIVEALARRTFGSSAVPERPAGSVLGAPILHAGV